MKQKGLSLIVIILFIALIAGGYLLGKPFSTAQQSIKSTPSSPPTSTPVSNLESFTPTRLSDQKTYIPNKIENIPDFNLPEGIEKNQLREPQKIGDTYFVMFLKSSMNEPIDSSVMRSGVLYAKEGSKDWKIFYEITDLIKGSSGKNNPQDFWKEGNTYFSVVVDNNGGGSGEGLGKLISIEAQLKQWKILDCFYFSPENYIEYMNSQPKNKLLSEAVKAYIEPSRQKNSNDYIYDNQINKFVIDNRVEDYCTAISLSF